MTDRYAVIGNPIASSRLPLIHGAFAHAARRELDYRAIEGPLAGFDDAVAQFRADGGRGLNVTAPFRGEALALATDPTAYATAAGAANALKFEGARIRAENFCGPGLVTDIERNLGLALRGRRLLLLGAGGAVRSALLPLLHARPAQVMIANRATGRASALARRFAASGPVTGCGYGDLAGLRFDVVINATGASLTGELPPVSPEVFAVDALAYELACGHGLTPFLRLAQNAGVRRLADGAGMLVEQAAAAFAWWHGIRPDTRPVLDAFRRPLV